MNRLLRRAFEIEPMSSFSSSAQEILWEPQMEDSDKLF
jgi:hypothetical protein